MFILLQVIWTSWICGGIVFIRFGKSLANIYSNTSSCLFIFSSPSGTPVTHILHHYNCFPILFKSFFLSLHNILVVFILTLQVHWFFFFFCISSLHLGFQQNQKVFSSLEVLFWPLKIYLIPQVSSTSCICGGIVFLYFIFTIALLIPLSTNSITSVFSGFLLIFLLVISHTLLLPCMPDKIFFGCRTLQVHSSFLI